ncbi:PREDICTED: mitotic spindle checkpoint protein MAD1-like isoform X1 [Camelina sativa]|uniref:Mitotic spindle checkpoint protein MAD1-like isoform X1 n=1 Tax=Camelina sativa TaxID=90675 RepID=A0ABM0UKG9_CAMSA|nr:PREDICTED: mitotic spindle checkpoint protein MAD1-like isoform X2 [Camelina sativa]XP_019088112.1 PREDICTED: mitotic spindle checkpoint protein MAD1-like isoform X1 [Camelina sativa]
MILRTPPPKRLKSDAGGSPISANASGSGNQLVIYEDSPLPAPAPLQTSNDQSDQHLCTYQCRQMVKADVLDAFSKAEKQVQEYQTQLQTLNANFSEADAERKQLRDHFLYSKQELAAAKGREKMLQEQLLTEINNSQERYTKELQSCHELEVKLQNEMNLRKKAESSAATAEEKAKLLEDKLTQLSGSVDREKKRLNNDIAQLGKEAKLSVSRIGADLERMQYRAQNAETESNLLRSQLEHLKLKFDECLQEKTEVYKKLSSFTSQTASSSDNSVLIKHLQEEVKRYEAEVQEARKLKSRHVDAELLKVKLLEENSRRERAESELSKFYELQQSMEKLNNELSSWKSLLNEIPGVSCPDDIVMKFSTLQNEVVQSSLKIGEASTRFKQLEVALEATQLGRQNAETEAALAKEKSEALKTDVKRIEVMLSLVTVEKEQLKAVVNELRKSTSEGSVPGAGATDGTLIQELESSLAKKENYLKDLENDLSQLKDVNNRLRSEIELLNEKLVDEARRNKSLERDSDRLLSEISLLESKLGHGDYSAANTRVLRMVNTLGVENEAKQTIEALQAELQKAKERLQAVEELKNQSGDAGKLVDSHITGKIAQLKEQIATLEKREERYKTVFADRISVFRRACCELFGYKIVMDEHQRPNGIPVTRFTLQSIYAQNDDEKLEFEYESGNTSILNNGYASQGEIAKQIEIFIRKFNSIPAFTANLTMESFNRRTLY